MDKRKKYELKQQAQNRKMFAARINRKVSEGIRHIASEKKVPIALLVESIFRDYIINYSNYSAD